MDILWPGVLFLLLGVPLIIAVYIWNLRRRKVGLRFSSLSLVRAALPRYSRLRRHLPFALLMLGLTSLIVAVARPVGVPSAEASNVTTLPLKSSFGFAWVIECGPLVSVTAPWLPVKVPPVQSGAMLPPVCGPNSVTDPVMVAGGV